MPYSQGDLLKNYPLTKKRQPQCCLNSLIPKGISYSYILTYYNILKIIYNIKKVSFFNLIYFLLHHLKK
nr:MAG TPA: hypothetical protein [Caudoviricetes sp.]